MPKDFKEKVVLITGGTSGIGFALAAKFAQEGAHVMISGRNEHKLEDALSRLEDMGLPVAGVLADASSKEDNAFMVDSCIKRFGGLDVLINNAGISMRALFNELQLQVFEQVMQINFWGTVYATKFALPHLLERKGILIGISSINGYRGTPARTAYTASKYAMNGFFEALRTEVMHEGVHVLVASPGFTASNIRQNALAANGAPQGESPREEEKMMQPEEVAEAIYQAALKRKRDLVLTTEGKLAVFLNKWIPGIMDRVVYRHMAKEKDAPFT
ncbi:short-chain dehydrogenase/reductase SDR [Nitritalea halalkaliphila LW7]|uniref:Short-chain dehydrogenase/reductase SDR n=1 Tax=Nitritalea halalkaliphila LW7 TaxID=1189621 RepID=I5C503_9BACT|nr:SDR family oxidoreductase [Nitritalea halalkaliphila]EIM76905.1 short-chain dehydrogenase/reductase SDR [Nitritalea halalkaliphila LW7]